MIADMMANRNTAVRPCPDHRLSVAPMMNHTDRHFRALLRLISRRVLLYTEMIPTGALLHGQSQRRLAHDARERPVALQLGGSDPEALARCARLAQDAGYDEVNLNVGCPSDRVQEARFGACLMAEPRLVADCVTSMAETTTLPVTVKTRIGIDEHDSYEQLVDFIGTVAGGGCATFIIHARKAWLQGLSPRENRHLPPLQYDTVYRLKRDFPALQFVLNGGIGSLEDALGHLGHVDGVMIGRAACSNPYLLHAADALVFGDDTPPLSREDVLRHYTEYAGRQAADGAAVHHLVRHVTGLFQGRPGARAFRRLLSERAGRPGTGIDCLREALKIVAA